MVRVLKWLKIPSNIVGIMVGFIPIILLIQYINLYSENIPRFDNATRTIHIAIAVQMGSGILKH